MKNISYIIILILFTILSCSENCVCPEEPIPDDGISWDQLTGRLVYLKGSSLYLLDADSGSVKALGAINLTNLKWNKSASLITGIRFKDDSTYSLEGIDLNGNHIVINNSISSKYYDWLPDGRLVTISLDNNILIDEDVLLEQEFNPVFGLACSPNGKKIIVSTDNIIENLLIEIDIGTLSQEIKARNSNLFDSNFLQPLYSLESDNLFYVTYTYQFPNDDWVHHISSIPDIELTDGKDPCRSDNLQKILCTKVAWNSGRIIGIYSIDVDGSDSTELIKDGHTPIWIY